MPVRPNNNAQDFWSAFLQEVGPIAGLEGEAPVPDAVVPAPGGPAIPTSTPVRDPVAPPAAPKRDPNSYGVVPLPRAADPVLQTKDAAAARAGGMETAYDQIGSVPDLRIDPSLTKMAQAPEAIDNTPVELPDAETVDYTSGPERDWQKEFSEARKSARSDRALNEVMRSIAGVGSALSGVKRDDAFFDRMAAGADRREAGVQKEYELDILANKGRQSRAEKDPASPQNRAAQEFFAANFGHLIPKGKEAAIRNMTGEQLLKMSGGASKMQLALSEIQSKGAATALAAGKEISRLQEKFVDQVHKREQLVTERGEKLTPIPKLQPGQEDPVSVRRAQGELSKYAEKSKGLKEIAGLMGELDRTVPGILSAKAEDIARLNLESMPEEQLRRFAPGIAAAILDKNPQETMSREQALSIRNTIEAVRRHEAFGSALTAGEQRLFNELVGRGWNKSSTVLVTALQVAYRALRRKAEETDYALRRVTQDAPSVYEGAYLDGQLNHQVPVFNSTSAVPGPKTGGVTQASGNKTDVNPAGAAKKFTPVSGKGTKEDPYIDAEGNKRVVIDGKTYKME